MLDAWFSHCAVAVVALLVDAWFGDPPRLWQRIPHPVVLCGRAIALGDHYMNKNNHRTIKGSIVLLLLLATASTLGVAIEHTLPPLVHVLIVAVLLAQRSLSDHACAVLYAMDTDHTNNAPNYPQARRAVAKLVGRDTTDFDQSAIALATIESTAESFNDGVVAPLFWYIVLGLPGILICKIINTADSMIAHKTPHYRAFGKPAAYADDAINWLPARIAAGIIVLTNTRPNNWTRVFGALPREARKHTSPNAGWGEAAFALVLGMALGGKRHYQGVICPLPVLNTKGKHTLDAGDINCAIDALWRAWCGVLLMLLVLLALF